MHISNLTLQEQHKNILEGLFSKDDDYTDWIKCVAVEKDVWMQRRLEKNIKPNVHLYPIQIFDDPIKKGSRWTQINNKIRLDESLNEEQQKQLWDLLEEFAWHKGKLWQCFIGEHSIDTQGLPPCRMTPKWLSYCEEIKINPQIQTLVDLGKMNKSALEYTCRVILLMKKDGSRRFCGDYCPFNHQTRRDSFPMPLIKDVLNQLWHSEWFSALDL